MAHEILSVKLYELDQKIGLMHSRIQLSETASHDQIKNEVANLRKECDENALTLRNKLKFSRAGRVVKLSEAYGKVEQIIEKVKSEFPSPKSERWNEELSVEEKLLLAEYALDFAVQVANHALLISMEAIEAQMTKQEKDEERKNERG